MIDLFAGTGALGIEALSRGATSATFIERHVPSAQVVEENVAELDIADRVTLRITSAFLWSKRDLAVGIRRTAARLAVARVLQSALLVFRRAGGRHAGPDRANREPPRPRARW